MSLHLIKLCVGCDTVEELQEWRRSEGDQLPWRSYVDLRELGTGARSMGGVYSRPLDVAALLDFIKGSKRGVCVGANESRS